jgi:hypothetical protein
MVPAAAHLTVWPQQPAARRTTRTGMGTIVGTPTCRTHQLQLQLQLVTSGAIDINKTRSATTSWCLKS